MTEINANSLDDLNSTLNLSESDSVEVDKLNNANLFIDTNLSQLNLISNTLDILQTSQAASLSLENFACTSQNSIAVNTNTSEHTKPTKRALRQNSSRNSNDTSNTDTNSGSSNMSSTTTSTNTSSNSTSTVKEQPIVIIDDKDNSSLIDLTKENDDIVIVSEVNCTNHTNSRLNSIFRRPYRTSRQTIRKLTSVSLNNNNNNNNIVHTPAALPSTSASATAITTSDVNTQNDMEVIQEVLNNDNSNKDRPCVDITYHYTRNNLRINSIPNLVRPNRTTLNSTIVLDDEREQTNDANTPLVNVTIDISSNLQSDSNTNNPKRLKLDRPSHKKTDNQKSNKNATSTSSNSEESSIQCPICLESLTELKANKKRLKSTLCGHILCNVCLEATFKSTGDGSGYNKSIFCPKCRTKLTKSKIHDLYL